MNPWWVVGTTMAFLIVSVIMCMVYLIFKGTIKTESTSSGSVIGVILIVVAILIIFILFMCHFYGVFNKVKVDPKRLSLKYDYLVQHEPVDILKPLTPQYSLLYQEEMVNLLPQFRDILKEALQALTQDKRRVEKALANVFITQDVRVLSNYAFSYPVVRLADFMNKHEKTIMKTDIIFSNAIITELREFNAASDAKLYIYEIDIGKSVKSQVHITTVIGLFYVFVQRYPKITEQCLINKACPFNVTS